MHFLYYISNPTQAINRISKIIKYQNHNQKAFILISQNTFMAFPTHFIPCCMLHSCNFMTFLQHSKESLFFTYKIYDYIRALPRITTDTSLIICIYTIKPFLLPSSALLQSIQALIHERHMSYLKT